jgi:hypothetical protein
MKRIIVTALFAGLLSTSCTREIVSVKANKDFLEKHEDYRTFTVVQNTSSVATLPNASMIEDEIEKQMKLRGYIESTQNADVLIAYSVFDKNIKLPEVTKVYHGLLQSAESSELHRRKLRNGIIIINLIDQNTQKTFWTGYASEVFKGRKLEDKTLKNITRAIFNNYTVRAHQYVALRN